MKYKQEIQKSTVELSPILRPSTRFSWEPLTSQKTSYMVKKIQFGTGPTITNKRTEQIDIDTLVRVEYLEFEQKVNPSKTEYSECKLKGLHQRRQGMAQIVEEYQSVEPNVFDVTIFGCKYCIHEEEIRQWLCLYRDLFGLLSENTYN